jgi:hypothetical protein
VVTLVWLAYLLTNNLATFSAAVVVLSLFITIPVAFVVSMAYSRLPAVKKLSIFIDTAAQCMGLVSPGFSVLPGFTPTFDPHQ